MKSFLFMLLAITVLAEPKHRKGERANVPNDEIASLRSQRQTPFQKCEAQVIPLSHKHFGAQNQNAQAFHVMMACAGLDGDPVVGRKGWKSYLYSCPPTPPNDLVWRQDPARSVERYHPCAEMCFKRSATKSWSQIIHEEQQLIAEKPELKPYDWVTFLSQEKRYLLDLHFPGQQCCYARGKLITTSAAAGTPDLIFRSPRWTPFHIPGTGPARAARAHEQFDVAIIKEDFPDWPKGWQEYFQLGWAPTGLRGNLQFGSLPEDAPCTSNKNPQSVPR